MMEKCYLEIETDKSIADALSDNPRPFFIVGAEHYLYRLINGKRVFIYKWHYGDMGDLPKPQSLRAIDATSYSVYTSAFESTSDADPLPTVLPNSSCLGLVFGLKPDNQGKAIWFNGNKIIKEKVLQNFIK